MSLTDESTYLMLTKPKWIFTSQMGYMKGRGRQGKVSLDCLPLGEMADKRMNIGPSSAKHSLQMPAFRYSNCFKSFLSTTLQLKLYISSMSSQTTCSRLGSNMRKENQSSCKCLEETAEQSLSQRKLSSGGKAMVFKKVKAPFSLSFTLMQTMILLSTPFPHGHHQFHLSGDPDSFPSSFLQLQLCPAGRSTWAQRSSSLSFQ